MNFVKNGQLYFTGSMFQWFEVQISGTNLKIFFYHLPRHINTNDNRSATLYLDDNKTQLSGRFDLTDHVSKSIVDFLQSKKHQVLDLQKLASDYLAANPNAPNE